MGKKKPVSYGDLHFDMQTEARAFLNAMLGKYDIGDQRIGIVAKLGQDVGHSHVIRFQPAACPKR